MQANGSLRCRQGKNNGCCSTSVVSIEGSAETELETTDGEASTIDSRMPRVCFSETSVSNHACKLLAAPPVTGEQTTEQQDNNESPNKRARTTFKYGVQEG